MEPPEQRPDRADVIDELARTTDRMLAVAATVDDAAARGASALPGWTRGHVLNHLARNADGLGNLVTWAETGAETPMYASAEARAADIEAGAARPAAELRADVAATARRLDERLAAMPSAAEEVEVRMLSGATAFGWEIPLLRIREVEVHLVDLAAGPTVGDWTEAFCARTLDQVAPGVAARGESAVGRLVTPDGRSWRIGDAGPALHGPLPSLVGWLLGRSDGSDLRPEGRADVPEPPRWG